jgi:hypothetical protein
MIGIIMKVGITTKVIMSMVTNVVKNGRNVFEAKINAWNQRDVFVTKRSA